MAHAIITADLGATGIKLARFETSFRRTQLIDTKFIPCIGQGKPEERIPAQLVALAEAIADSRYHVDELTLGLPGDALAFRLVDLPFAGVRQIESVLSYELETLVLAPVEELVVDFLVVGPTGKDGAETRVLAATAPNALVELIIRTANERALPLRGLVAGPLAYPALLAATGIDAGAGIGAGESMVVDLGAETTTVCTVRDGKPENARSIGRGGRQIRDAVMAAFGLDEEKGERAKVDSGFVAQRGLLGMSPAQAHMDATVRQALRPLVRELKQTLAAHKASYGRAVDRLWLTGGGSRLSGLREHLAEELGLSVDALLWPPREGWAEPPSVAGHSEPFSVAVGLALGQATQATQVSFRKGEFSYRSDYSFLRGKAVHLSVCAALVLCFVGLNAYASLRGLRKEHDQLTARLKKATLEVFQQERTDPRGVSEDMRGGPKGTGPMPFPTLTAFDLVDEMSRVVPAADKIKLDVVDLDIKPKKTSLKGTVETREQVDDLVAGLKQIECFEDIQQGKITNVTVNIPCDKDDKSGSSDDKPADKSVKDATKDKDGKDGKDKDAKESKCGPKEMKQFMLSIKTSCP